MIIYNNHYFGGVILDNNYVLTLTNEKIREKMVFQSSLLESVNDSIVVAGIDGKISFWNNGSERLFGWTAEEILGKPFSVLLEDSNIKDIPKQVIEINVGFWEGRVIIQTKNKSKKYARVSATAMYNYLNKPAYLVGVFSDITELIESKIKAEEALRSKSEFLANISHEIRTPITAILGYAELLTQSSLDEKQEFYIQSIRDNTEQLLVLFNDILDISKIEADKILLDESEFNIEELIISLKSIFVPMIEKKQLNLTVNIAPQLPSNIIADKTRIKQILSNLLSNAIKFTESGGITINVAKKDTDSNSNEFNLIIEVVDTGIGIPPDKLDLIFEPFSQADSSTTRKYGGTGLGLAICHKLIEILGGEIEVESKEGVGSRFMFSAPVTAAIHPNSKDLFYSDETHRNKHKLLLISTDGNIFDQLSSNLSDYDWQILWLKNKTRLSAVNSFYEPEIVLVDTDTIYLDKIPSGLNIYYLGEDGIRSIPGEKIDTLKDLISQAQGYVSQNIDFAYQSEEPKILIIDENTINVLLMEKILQTQNYLVDSITDIKGLQENREANSYEIIIVDIDLLKKYDEFLYNKIKSIKHRKVIALAHENDNYNNDLINDYLYKPLTSKKLLSIVKRNIEVNKDE